ncbi:helix-turn-helix transcriptional regulator [Halococcoides cellulosivorans]|uniref:DUF4897 domain-containing protein n=1 Tax=Halococcoides cellulosivorans TaxID=1679096 RepID=A0A2R4WY04_9EURY|nr:hypothetical protein [Halococcoides cellulosivorans]AWB26425.1 hypothetical protein HARCEL1_01150 [Halococcoides cellulosivorans]
MRTVTVAVLAVALVAVATAGAAWSPAVDGQAVDADTVLMEADLQPSGTAVWTVAYRVRLDTDNETTAFEELRADVRDNESRYATAFRERMSGTVDAAAEDTGRAMTVANVSADARITRVPRSTGVLTYRFEWTGFARADGDRLIAGDALSGLYLDSNTVLTMAWPSDYETTRVAPSGEAGNRSVTWYGPRDFGPNEPSVAVAPADTASGPSGVSAGSQWPLVVIALALVVLLVVLGYGWHRRGDDADPTTTEGTSSDHAGVDETAADPDRGASADDTADGPPFDQSLLRNDEQVVRLLDANDGRMKQQAIAATLDWTDAKTSQVVGGLRDEGRVETFRIGRENVVELTTDGDPESA